MSITMQFVVDQLSIQSVPINFAKAAHPAGPSRREEVLSTLENAGGEMTTWNLLQALGGSRAVLVRVATSLVSDRLINARHAGRRIFYSRKSS